MNFKDHTRKGPVGLVWLQCLHLECALFTRRALRYSALQSSGWEQCIGIVAERLGGLTSCVRRYIM